MRYLLLGLILVGCAPSEAECPDGEVEMLVVDHIDDSDMAFCIPCEGTTCGGTYYEIVGHHNGVDFVKGNIP